MSRLILIPPAGKVGVFSGINDPRVTHLGIPRGQRVFVLKTQPQNDLPRARRLIEEFKKSNHCESLVYDGTIAGEEGFGRALGHFKPEIVFLPHPDAADGESQRLYRAAVKFLTGTIGLSYETPGINAGFNLYTLFGEQEMRHKLSCLRFFRSQLQRVRFDLVAKHAARQAAEELRAGNLPGALRQKIEEFPYAERFITAGFLPRGETLYYSSGGKIVLTPADPWKTLCGPKATFFSPHHDDLEIPAAFTISALALRGTLVHNLVLSSGKEGVTGGEPWVTKHLIRNRELAEASRIEGVVPIDLSLFHDFPEKRPHPNWRHGAEKLIEGFFQRFNPKVIFLPLPGDPHPDHQLTYDLVLRVAQRSFKKGYWGRGAYPNVIFYASPWYSGPQGLNAYHYTSGWASSPDKAAEYAARVKAIVGAELAMNHPGIKPPKPVAFGGRFAEGFLIHRL